MTTQINLNNIVKDVIEHEVNDGNLSNVIFTKNDIDSLLSIVKDMIAISLPINDDKDYDELSSSEDFFNELLNSNELSNLSNIPELSSFTSEELLDRRTYLITEADIDNFINSLNSTLSLQIRANNDDDYYTGSPTHFNDIVRSSVKYGKQVREIYEKTKNEIIKNTKQLIDRMKAIKDTTNYADDYLCPEYRELVRQYDKLIVLDKGILDKWNTSTIKTTEETVGFWLGFHSPDIRWSGFNDINDEIYDLAKKFYKKYETKVLSMRDFTVTDVTTPISIKYLNKLHVYNISPERDGRSPVAITYNCIYNSDRSISSIAEVSPVCSDENIEPGTSYDVINLYIGYTISSEYERTKVFLIYDELLEAFSHFSKAWDHLHKEIYELLDEATALHEELHKAKEGNKCSKKSEWYGHEQEAPLSADLYFCSEKNSGDYMPVPTPNHTVVENNLIKFVLIQEYHHYCARSEKDGCLNESAHRTASGWDTPVYVGDSEVVFDVTMCPYHDGTDVENYIKRNYDMQGFEYFERANLDSYNRPVWITHHHIDHTQKYGTHGEPIYYPVDVNVHE